MIIPIPETLTAIQTVAGGCGDMTVPAGAGADRVPRQPGRLSESQRR